MKKTILKHACISAFAIAFSLSAHSGGGGSDGGGSDGLPLPDTCTSNCGYEVGPNPTQPSVHFKLARVHYPSHQPSFRAV